MRARSTLIIIAFAIQCHLVGSAANAGDYTRFGPYVGLNAAYGIDLFEGSLASLKPGEASLITVGQTPGLNARLGLRFLTILAVEAQYEWFKGFDVAFAGVDIFRIGNHTLTGNLKLFLPIWRVQPYLLGGVGVTWWNVEGLGLASVLPSQSGNGFAGRLGGGIEFYITEHFLIDAEATAVLTSRELDVGQIIGTPASLDRFYYMSISAGLTYRF